MKEQVDRFLEHAADALDDASFLHQDGRVLALANRAYYAIFYCVFALTVSRFLTEYTTDQSSDSRRLWLRKKVG